MNLPLVRSILGGVMISADVVKNAKVVDKLWGREYWLLNNEKYCAKILTLNYGWQCSLHYHKVKDETFTVLDGCMFLETQTVERLGASKFLTQANPGAVIRIPPGVQHRFRGGPEGAVVLEVSTTHDDADTYRIEDSCACSPVTDKR